MNEEYKVNDLINKYIDYLKYERKLSENTIKSYYQNLKQLDIYYNGNIKDLTYNDILNFIHSIDDKKARSVAHYITVLNSFYSFLVNEKIINENPCSNIASPKLPKKLPNYLTEEEVDKLLNITLITPYDYRNKAMLELLYASGLRISELTNLKLSDIDLHNCFVRVFGKGKKERIVPLTDLAINYLRTYITEYRNLILKNKDLIVKKIFLVKDFLK